MQFNEDFDRNYKDGISHPLNEYDAQKYSTT